MRLFVDCRWLAQPGQGIVTYISELHKAVTELPGFVHLDITIVCGVTRLADVSADLIPAGCEVIEVGRRSFLWRLLAFPFWLRRKKIDAAHFQYVTPLFKLGAKYIVTIHDILFISNPEYFSYRHRWVRWPFYYWSSRLADVVLTVSEQSKRDISTFFGRGDDVVVVHNAFPSSKDGAPIERPACIPEGLRYLLTVGRVEPRKNYPRLVEGFEQSGLAAEGYHLVIVGFCDDEFTAERIQIDNRQSVFFLDYVTEDSLLWLYKNAAAFIYPSICEGFGIPLLEAMSHGISCAVSSTYPLEDAKRASAVVFEPLERDDIARACRAVVDGPKANPEISDLTEKYSWKRSAKTYVDAIDDCIRISP